MLELLFSQEIKKIDPRIKNCIVKNYTDSYYCKIWHDNEILNSKEIKKEFESDNKKVLLEEIKNYMNEPHDGFINSFQENYFL